MEDKGSNNSTKETMSAEQEKLNAVRDLLFGQNVQEYRQEFEELKKIIEDEKAANTAALKQIESSLVSRIEKLENNLTEKITKLDNSKTDRRQLASLLHEIANQLES